MSLVVHTDING